MNWDDIEDLDEEIDFDRMWEDDDYREELQYAINDLCDSMVQAYKDNLKEENENI